ncbi:hypothetical protein ES703_28524 [subsurface metagenome]
MNLLELKIEIFLLYCDTIFWAGHNVRQIKLEGLHNYYYLPLVLISFLFLLFIIILNFHI